MNRLYGHMTHFTARCTNIANLVQSEHSKIQVEYRGGVTFVSRKRVISLKRNKIQDYY